MQASSLYRPSGLASDSHLVSASAPIGKTSKLSTLVEDQLELTERDLWEDDADVSENEAIVASTSAPTSGLGHSSESEHEPEPPSPDIKAFHGDSKPHQQDSASSPTDTVASENAFTQSAARRSTDSARHSMDSTSAMPIGSVASHRSRRPPLRANSTFASRDGLHRQAAVKMGSSAPINIPIMSRLPFITDEDEDAAKKPFVPPHKMLDESKKNGSLQQRSAMTAGISAGASVKSRKLQQRNAILRSTGFIEGPACVKGVGEVMDPIKESHLETLHSKSKLTEALGSSPHVGSSC